MRFAQSQVANAKAHFAHVALIADPGVLRGRRYGNIILVASNRELPVIELARRAASDPFPSRVVFGEKLDAFQGGVKAVGDADAVQSPPQPRDMFGDRG